MMGSNRGGGAAAAAPAAPTTAATAPAPDETEGGGGGVEGSPHFRPAVIDGVVALDSPGQAAKKRKSLGRRVSFAAKAKVRFIDKDSDDDEGNVQRAGARGGGEEENAEDDNIFLVSKPDFVVSPRRISTGRAMLEAGKDSPASEGAISTLSNGSIEVEVRDPASSSFSSYDSVTEENVTQLDEMEMTKCVGGIIDAAVRARSAGREGGGGAGEGLLGEEFDENNTMDLTSCVGGILSNLPIAPPTSPTSIDTMELTRAVGGIMENLGSVHSPPTTQAAVANGVDQSRKDSDKTIAAGADTVDMEMTAVLKDTIKATAIPVRSALTRTPVGGKGRGGSGAGAAASGSPSPFLVNGNNGGGTLAEAAIAGDSVLTMMMAPLSPVHSEISFIGDMDQPKDFALAASPAAPSGGPLIDSQEQAELDLTTELFNKYIDTSRFNALTLDSQPGYGSQATDSKLGQTTDVKLGQTTDVKLGQTTDVKLSQTTDVKFSQTLSLPALPKTPAKVVGGGNIAMTFTPATAIGTASPLPGPPSQVESPTVTLILPRASLKDFLTETGIRFLDNLSSLTRRETTGRPRESELITEDRQLYVDCGLSLESDALDEACGVLAGQIEAIREELSRQEEQFNHSPPLAFLQYRDPQERSTVIGKLKTFKSIARLFAKQAWYEWRRPVHARLNQALASNVQVLLERVGALTPLDAELDRLLAQLEPAVLELSQAVALLEERAKRFITEDVEQVARMEALAAEQQTNLSRLDSEMDSLVRREQELRTAIDAALHRRQELHASVANLQQDLEAVPECSPLILDELRSGLSLLQGATGWRISRIASDGSHKIVLCHQRSAISTSFIIRSGGGGGDDDDGATVDEVTFDISAVKSPLLKHVPRITQIPSGLAVPRCLLMVGQKLDRLCHLDKQLAVVGVQCTVSIPEMLGPQLEAVPLALGFYHAPSRVKFDLLLTVDGDRLAYSQFVPFAGGLQEHHLVDAVNLSLLQKWHPIRRLVTAVTEIIEQQA